ncbi:MAG: MBL fold metallo-hydrolase [Bryobacteraceae bacterium]|nr:MBL fold metallo-hydrolase [Bryobacteraceae bacterium]
MIHEIFPVGMLACNCSLFGDETSREAIVIDPGDDVEEILRRLQRHGLRLRAIVITHAHLDHIGGAAALKKRTGAPIYLNQRDLPILDQVEMQAAWLGVEPPEKPAIDADLGDGDELRLGESSFLVLHTPGHTPGSVGLWIPAENKLIAGDTLFRESIGRTDLPGGDGRRILVSIREKFLPLPEDAIVVPGHGPLTTLAHERRHNYFLQRM